MTSAQTFRLPSNTTLGAKFLQDAEKGVSAGVCVAHVDKEGAAARAGIVVGMLVWGIGGQPVKDMPFNDIMQLVRDRKGERSYYELQLIHPNHLDPQVAIRWASLMDSKGLNEFATEDDAPKGVMGGLRRLSVAVGATKEDLKPGPLNLAPGSSNEPGSAGRRRDSIHARRQSITPGMGPLGSTNESDESPPNSATSASSRRRGSIATPTSMDGSQSLAGPPAGRRRGSIATASSDPPQLLSSSGLPSTGSEALVYHGKKKRDTSPGAGSPDQQLSSDASPGMLVKYRVLAKCTVREGKNADSAKVGEYKKGMMLDVVEESSNRTGLVVVKTTNTTDTGARGGWVKIRTAKGKRLLEKQQGVRSGRRMSVATTGDDGVVIQAAEELIDLHFEGTGALGILFEDPGQDPEDGITVKRIVPDSIAHDIPGLDVGLILRMVDGEDVGGKAYREAMQMIGSHWRAQEDGMTLTFAFPDIAEDSEEEEDDAQDAAPILEEEDEEAAGSGSVQGLVSHSSPGGRNWVDGSQLELRAQRMASVDSVAEGEEEEEEEQEDEEPTPLDLAADEPEEAEPPAEAVEVPTDVFEFMKEHAAAEYAEQFCSVLGVTRVEDFLDLEDADFEQFSMKTIPRRRLAKAISAMREPPQEKVAEATPPEPAADKSEEEAAERAAAEQKLADAARRAQEAEEQAIEMQRKMEELEAKSKADAAAAAQAATAETERKLAEERRLQEERRTAEAAAQPAAASVTAQLPDINVYISPFLDDSETGVEISRIRRRMNALEGQAGNLKCMRKDYTGWDTVETFDA